MYVKQYQMGEPTEVLATNQLVLYCIV